MTNQKHTPLPLVHAFESRGLGKAPFRIVEFYVSVGPIEISPGHFVGSPGQPMGTCEHCGTGIANIFIVESSDGKRSKVGSTCVLKTGDSGLKRVVNQKISELKTQKDLIRIAKAKKIWETSHDLRKSFMTLPHPFGVAGSSLAGYIDYLFLNGGTSGKIRASRKIEQAINQAEGK